jgi:predicted nucleotidyltransferase component of viral defense system
MQIGDKDGLLINFINTMLSDVDDDFILTKPEWAGSYNLDVGDTRSKGKKSKKYQYIKGELAIPHNILKDEFQQNLDVMYDTRMFHYAYIPKKFVTDELLNQIEEAKQDILSFLVNHPKVKEALDNLINVLKEERSK